MQTCAETGRLMARYCVAFESMKRFLGLKGKETLADLVSTYRHACIYGIVLFVQVRELCLCQEFADVRLRVNEKRILNGLNKDKNKPTIRLIMQCLLIVALLAYARYKKSQYRFPMNGKIKSTDMKVNWYDFDDEYLPVYFILFSQSDPGHSRLSASAGVCSQSRHSGNFFLHQLLHRYHSFSHPPLPLQKIFRAAYRLSKCKSDAIFIISCALLNTVFFFAGLMELQMAGNSFALLHNSVLLHKCLQSKYTF